MVNCPIHIANNTPVTFGHQEVGGEAFQVGFEFFPTYRNKVVGNSFLFPLSIQMKHFFYILGGALSNENILHVSTFLETLTVHCYA